MGFKMAELSIKGNKKYIRYLSNHLKKEHPSTKRRMEVEGLKKHHKKKRR